MSLTPSFKAIYASQGILGNAAEARLEHFEYFENNPNQALVMLNYSKNNARKIFQSIPKGRESEHVEIVKRAWSALQLPPESAELNAFLHKHEVIGTPQVKPINSFLEGDKGLIKPSATTVLIISLILFFTVVMPIAGWLINRSTILGVVLVVLYFVLVSKFLKRVKGTQGQKRIKVNSPNLPPSRSKEPEKRKEWMPEVEPTHSKLPFADKEERMVSIENREAKYDRKEERKNYRKG